MESPIMVKIVRKGASLGITLPKQILETYAMGQGDRVVFVCDDSAWFKVVPVSNRVWESIKRSAMPQ